MGNDRRRRVLFLAFPFLLVVFMLSQLNVWASFPKELRVLPGQNVEFDVGPFFTVVTLPEETASPSETASPPTAPGNHRLELRLFGWVPLQRAEVKVVERVEVVPGGQAVGILLSAQGLVVVRTVPVTTPSGERRAPAERAGILPGDILTRVGDRPIDHPLELESLVQHYGQRGEPVPLTVVRKGEERRVEVVPVPAEEPDGRGPRYMLGLFLKDPAAGVGTLTFWDPETGAYGALGHVIADDGSPVSLHDGRIVPAFIQGVHPGVRGRPGEKMGIFQSGASLGSIEKNTPVGIFGRLTTTPAGAMGRVPVALAHEVKEGPAEILTVLEGDRVERFDVQITSVSRQSFPGGKGLIIEVSDPRLLARTNGIVQGMSGSPILQDGKLVGAVTHVFVNNPAKGFGVLAEWMVYEAGLGGAS